MKTYWLILLCGLVACVPAKKYNTERTQRLQMEREKATLERQLRAYQADKIAYRDSLLQTKSKIDTLAQQKDSIRERAGDDLRLLANQLDRLANQLRQKENELTQKEKALQDREKNIRQLRRLLAQQQQANQALKQRIKTAITGLDTKDLAVELRDGRVYVSLSDKILFDQSSIQLDPAGEQALEQLAIVLNKNPDFLIQIEGHTDAVPFAPGSEYQDNWDLSVLRAAVIARLLVKNKVTPTRIIAAGLSKYHPIADNDTEAGRKKNRRTEIVLIPDTKKIFELLE
ncbi:MAG: OmpA family protein [Bernardetiaceae bacterium]